MRAFCRILPGLLTVLSAWAAPPANQPPPDRRRSPVVRVFEKSRDAVVNISTTRVIRMRTLGFDSPLGNIFEDMFQFGRPRVRNQRVHSVGSGVVVHESGYIVTNAHVVSQASDIQVTFADGRTQSADILAVDFDHDLAVLKLDADRPLAALELGRSDDIMVGETVVAIGNPLGLQHTVTAGIVSALNRDFVYKDQITYRGLIQTDASINHGNSGGPLLNVNAQLIGINTAIRGDAQNIGFAIPVNRLWELLPVMLDVERRERVRFGLRVSGPQAEVLAIRPDSPAAKTDLQRGDRITRFNGKPIRNGIDYYVYLLEQEPGDEIQLAVQRNGTSRSVKVPLQAVPLPDGQKLAQRLLGVKLGLIPRRIHRVYGLPAHIGLMVEQVDPGSPADRARMQAGDLILRVDRVTTATLKDMGLALEQVTPGERVIVEGIRLEADGAYIWPPVSIKTRP